MQLFRLPYTQKYDMYHLLGDDNILILKTSDTTKINDLTKSMARHDMTTFKELPARVQLDCICRSDSSDYAQTVPVNANDIQRWINNGYLVQEVAPESKNEPS